MAADVSVHIGLDSVNITLISHYSGERDRIKCAVMGSSISEVQYRY